MFRQIRDGKTGTKVRGKLMKKTPMKNYSEDFVSGVIFTEDSIQCSIFESGIDETKGKIIKGYNELLLDVEKYGEHSVTEKLLGGMYALHLFLKRHEVKHNEWRFKS